MSFSKLFVLLPVHNRKETTLNFLRQLSRQTYKSIQPVVIDDGSKDGTAEQIKREFPQTVILKGDGSLWWGGSLQKGYHYLIDSDLSDDDCVLIINDDTHFKDNYVEMAIELLKENPSHLVYSRCSDTNTNKTIDRGVVWNWDEYIMRIAEHDGEVNCCSTRGLFMTFKTFKSIGPFRPNRIPHFLSDYEYTIRAIRKGHLVITHDAITVTTDSTPSGFSDLKYSSARKLFQQLFSIKYYQNPKIWIWFIIYTSPSLKLTIKNIFKVLNETSFHLKTMLLNNPKTRFFAHILASIKRVFIKVKKSLFAD